MAAAAAAAVGPCAYRISAELLAPRLVRPSFLQPTRCPLLVHFYACALVNGRHDRVAAAQKSHLHGPDLDTQF